MGVDKSDIHIINPPSDKSVEDNSIWLMGKLRELVGGSSKPVVIIGHSKGGAESLVAAVQNLDFTKQHVRALVLIQGAMLGSPITEDLADSKGLPEPPGTTDKQWSKIYELTKTTTRAGLQGMLKRGLGSIRRDESIARWKRLEAIHPGALQALSDRIFYIRTHKDVEELTLVLKMTGYWLGAHYGRSDGMMLIDDQRLEGIGRDMLIMSGADHSDLTVSFLTSTRPSSWRSATMALIVRELHRDGRPPADPQP
jgi:pimeloyl-ACP methyl ester carboxylesterase